MPNGPKCCHHHHRHYWIFHVYILPPAPHICCTACTGADVRPILIPAKKPGEEFNQNGIELQTSERYDVLITTNHPTKDAFVIHADR